MDIDRAKFDVALAELFGALDKPLTDAKRDGFWKGLQKMSWVQFCRARDQVLRELETSEAPKAFTVGSVWAAYNRTRAKAPSGENTLKEILADRDKPPTGRQANFDAEFKARFGVTPAEATELRRQTP